MRETELKQFHRLSAVIYSPENNYKKLQISSNQNYHIKIQSKPGEEKIKY